MQETKTGSINRANNAKKAIPTTSSGDVPIAWIGIENGLMQEGRFAFSSFI
jgi:non-canonical (house-cleaning) NTP pyrophosphatase